MVVSNSSLLLGSPGTPVSGRCMLNMFVGWGLKYTQNCLVQFPRGSLVFWNIPLIYCLQSLHFLHITPTQTKKTISILQSCSLLGFLTLPHTRQPASGRPAPPLVNPGYPRYAAPPPALWRGFRWPWGSGRGGRWKEERTARARPAYRGSWACPSQCWCTASPSCPQMHQSLLEWEWMEGSEKQHKVLRSDFATEGGKVNN